MRWFGQGAARDREHLAQAVRSLGTSSVAGLSAALSWSTRRTERTLMEAVARSGGHLRFDPVRRSVSWVAPERVAPPAAPVAASPTPSPPTAPTPPTASATPPALPRSWNASPKCPNCQVAFQPTGTGNHLYCPECGRLATARSGAAAPTGPSAPKAESAAPPAAGGSTLTLGSDRRAQELFAAWVTSQPIPCPKCRTPLRHHGVAEYACPGCGTRIAFERSNPLPARTAAPAAAPPSS